MIEDLCVDIAPAVHTVKRRESNARDADWRVPASPGWHWRGSKIVCFWRRGLPDVL